jgi:hypothetical protein
MGFIMLTSQGILADVNLLSNLFERLLFFPAHLFRSIAN